MLKNFACWAPFISTIKGHLLVSTSVNQSAFNLEQSIIYGLDGHPGSRGLAPGRSWLPAAAPFGSSLQPALMRVY